MKKSKQKIKQKVKEEEIQVFAGRLKSPYKEKLTDHMNKKGIGFPEFLRRVIDDL